jgi:hypothetical protein
MVPTTQPHLEITLISTNLRSSDMFVCENTTTTVVGVAASYSSPKNAAAYSSQNTIAKFTVLATTQPRHEPPDALTLSEFLFDWLHPKSASYMDEYKTSHFAYTSKYAQNMGTSPAKFARVCLCLRNHPIRLDVYGFDDFVSISKNEIILFHV